ncbi:hypothetical protein CLPUN_21310 [Clostridium puniceum]|uniref:Alpha/beta hydrolase family protein n=1 Tax=Clostridium puniceum TaxID=29367 RepID=A0A1S8TJK6_9CLOT|nr:hypothetical protein [Clostridium puniceum]OOM77958.1 hypothetical protein CLPUN_21310 [Clostridium puniceum]
MILKFLKEETKNYKIICIGSSAGGYMATLVGSILKAEYVIAFSPQFSISNYVFKKETKYLELIDIIHKNLTTIFYFCPFYNLEDQNQYKLIQNEINVKTFTFDSNKHGIPINKIQLRDVINMSYNQLIRLHSKWSGKITNKKEFIQK